MQVLHVSHVLATEWTYYFALRGILLEIILQVVSYISCSVNLHRGSHQKFSKFET